MGDNRSAFQSEEYDKKIKQTLPYYEDFYRQITELVKACHFKTLNWLDVEPAKWRHAPYRNLQ